MPPDVGVGGPLHEVGWWTGARWCDMASCGLVLGIWPVSLEIYCRTPILDTHPQGPIGPCVGPSPLNWVLNMRLGVGEPPHGVG